ncbi:MAG: GFA family protein [Legionellales bacterium]|nr:GFA family protein [Legionellales bacterium]
MNQYQGQCLCGACHYIITAAAPTAMYLCHCSRCRKETGTSHAATVFFQDAQLVWQQGENNMTHFTLENTRKQRSFCKTCGSPLPRSAGGTSVVLPAGTLNEDTSLQPTAHIFYLNRASWEDKLINLKRFEGLPE